MKLNELHSPADIKQMSVEQLQALSDSLRGALLEKLSRNGGHIGPNLGVVELTVALHYVFDAPTDKIVFDVSHQSYVHKMLTGRIEAFIDPAHYRDVSGYTNPDESPYDIFKVGHTSTSVSLAGGLAKARDLKGGTENVIALIGDGSLSGGEAFEGLDFAAELKSNFIVIVNDNDMSIAENHGGLYDNLRMLRETDGKAPLNYFKALGFDYRYVAYGNDMTSLVNALREVKDIDHPVVVHVNTQKGKGFAPAEAFRERYHYGAPFDLETGSPLRVSEAPDYGAITANHLVEMMKTNRNVAVITAATPGSFGFTPDMRAKCGDRFIDVGIAEQEAVALASGLAKGGIRPFFGVNSTFIQRAYDQLSQDVAINNTPVVVGIFYGTIFGLNDVTHLGWFDIPLISNIPGFIYLAPTCKEEYLAMVDWALQQTEHPVAVRVPGMKVISTGKAYPVDYSALNKFEMTHHGKRVAIIGAGAFYQLGLEVAARLASVSKVDATIINPRFLSGVDADMLTELEQDHSLVITLEDGLLDGGFGEKIARFYGTSPMQVRCYGIKKEFADRYAYDDIARENRLTPELITNDILATLQ